MPSITSSSSRYLWIILVNSSLSLEPIISIFLTSSVDLLGVKECLDGERFGVSGFVLLSGLGGVSFFDGKSCFSDTSIFIGKVKDYSGIVVFNYVVFYWIVLASLKACH